MAVITTLVITGIAVAVTGIGAYLCTKDDVTKAEIEQRIKEIDSSISSINTAISKFNTINNKTQSAITYLDNGKSDFTNGGHVFNDTPLAKTEFENTRNKLTYSIECINRINYDLSVKRQELDDEKKQLQAKMAELK